MNNVSWPESIVYIILIICVTMLTIEFPGIMLTLIAFFILLKYI